jgi:hypothetical protein
MDANANLALARRQVAVIKGFYVHLVVFVLVMGVLLAIDTMTGPDWWVQWPLLGWGAGLLAHAFVVFGHSPGFIANWETNKIADVKRRLDERETISKKEQTE